MLSILWRKTVTRTMMMKFPTLTAEEEAPVERERQRTAKKAAKKGAKKKGGNKKKRGKKKKA